MPANAEAIPESLAEEWHRFRVRLRQADTHVRQSVTLRGCRNVRLSRDMPERISLDTAVMERLTSAIEFCQSWADNPFRPGLMWQAAVLRGAIECASTVHWAIADGDDALTKSRLLALALHDARHTPDDARSAGHAREVREALAAMGVEPPEGRRNPLSYGRIVREATETGAHDFAQWELAAGASHGQSWSMDRLSRVVERDEKSVTIPDLDIIVELVDTAVRLTETAVTAFLADCGYTGLLTSYPNYWAYRRAVISVGGAAEVDVDAEAHEAHQFQLATFERYRAAALNPGDEDEVMVFSTF